MNIDFSSFLATLNNIASFFTTTLLGSVILSLLTSFAFIHLLIWAYRPNILICPYICLMRFPDFEPNPNKYFYVIKIVNKSRFDAYDIRLNLVKKEPYIVNDGAKINHRLTSLETSAKFKDHLFRYKKDENYGENAYMIRTDEDIAGLIIDPNISVRLTVCARHGLTNLTRIVHHEFTSTSYIKKDHEFVFGSSLGVKIQ